METLLKKRALILNIIVFAGALILGSLYFGSSDAQAVKFSLDGRTVSLAAGREFALNVPLDEVDDILLVRDPDFGGALQDGGTNSRCRYGTWHNEEWGDYALAAEQRLHNCIVLRVGDGGDETAGDAGDLPEYVVFNYESDTTTESLHKALREYAGF